MRYNNCSAISLLTTLRFSARFEPGGLCLVGFRFGEQCANGNAEHDSHGLEGGNSYVFHAAFNTSDIGAINLGFERQTLLRKATLDPQLSQVPADDLLSIHN